MGILKFLKNPLFLRNNPTANVTPVGLPNGISGYCSLWSEARQHTTGYNAANILQKVKTE
jgi:hypothetical protein